MTKLQCGWEDDCPEEDCLNCPRRNKVTVEITEAELSCVEDCGTLELQQYQKENPEKFKLMQNVMLQLMRKLFKVTKWD